MKKILLSVVALLAIYSTSQAQVIFLEDFDGIPGPTAGGPGTYAFPSGWTLANVDNRAPAASVNYINDAWERREDFSTGGSIADSCALSTSWTTPAGVANDWMVTPAIPTIPANTVLSWRAKAFDPAYPDGYEVRIMTVAPTGGTGVIGNLVSASTVLFSVTAEGTAWTAHTVNLNAYAGQTVYVAFRNNSNDKFVLAVDNVKLEVQAPFDAKLVSLDTVPEYTVIPKNQVYSMPTLATIKNNGVSAISNLRLKLNVYNGTFTQIYTNSGTAVATLAPGASAQLSAGSYTLPATPDTYIFEYIATHSVADSNPVDDTLYNSIVVDDSIYARDNGDVVGSLGIGAGNGGFLGQSFTVFNAGDALSSVGFYVTRGYTGRKTACVLWNMAGGMPGTIIASSDTLLYPDDSARFYTLPIHGGAYALAPGTYVITAVEFDSTLALGQSSAIFKRGTTWVDWPTSPITGWAHNENFATTFEKAYVLRLNLNHDCSSFFVDASSSTPATCGTCTDGSASTTITGGTPGFTYAWSNSGFGSSITGVTPGTYTVTVTDAQGCSKMDTVTVANNCTSFAATTTSTDATCATCADGSVGVGVSGGTGATYTWAPGGGTGAMVSGLTPGTYTVTASASGCTTTATATVGNSCTGFIANATATDASCGICADGTATVNLTGGTGSTYVWAPAGGNAATATGLTPGTYTVSVTDASGCVATATTTVSFSTSLVENEVSVNTTVYPNPGKDVFTVHIPEAFGNEAKITVTNYLGETVYSKSVNSFGNKEISLSDLASGKYTVQVTSAKYTVNKKLTIIK